MNINNVEVSILVDGKPIKFYAANGKTFVCSNYGAEYEIRIKNSNYYRIMAVASVDGLSVLDGKPASKDGSGYVVDGYSSISIKGYSKDNDTVGAFRFTKKKKGYAKEVTGSSENSGIIAVAVFAEKQNMAWFGGNGTTTWTSNPTFTTSTPNWDYNTVTCQNLSFSESMRGSAGVSNGSVCGGSINASSNHASDSFLRSANYCHVQAQEVSEPEIPNFSASTSWGSKLDDRVVSTTFEKASSVPLAEFNIYYDIKENLEKIGISFQQPKQVAYPKAFPNGFATPPAGWP